MTISRRRKIRFLNPEVGLINTKDPIPLHISAYGPRSQALTAKLNAGWKSFVSDVPGAMGALEGMQQSWNAAGRSAGDLYSTAWTCGCVLGDGEPADSPRAVAQAGPRAAVLLHRAADFDMEGWQNTSRAPQAGSRRKADPEEDFQRNPMTPGRDCAEDSDELAANNRNVPEWKPRAAGPATFDKVCLAKDRGNRHCRRERLRRRPGACGQAPGY